MEVPIPSYLALPTEIYGLFGVNDNDVVSY